MLNSMIGKAPRSCLENLYKVMIRTLIVDEEKKIVVDRVAARQVFGWDSIVGPAKRTVNAE